MKIRPPFLRGFTLIEVALGMAILILIFGVIFQLVQFSVLGADAAGKFSRRNREIGGLFALVRQLCLDLPVRSQLGLEAGPGKSGGYELVLSNAPIAILPERFDGKRTLRFALRPAPVGGGKVLWLEEKVEVTQPGNPMPRTETNTFALMGDLVNLVWLAGDPRNPPGQRDRPDWNDPIKPAYLRLDVVRREGRDLTTNTGIFWIPTGYGPGGVPPIDPLTLGPLVLTNTNPSP